MNKEPTPEEFVEKFLICPLTGKLFNTPVIGDDNNIYEQSAYMLKFGQTENLYYVVTSFKAFIDTFLDTYPKFKQLQYDSSGDIRSYEHSINVKEIQALIDKGKYTNLQKYGSFSLKYLPKETVEKLLNNADDITLKYFIDNITDITVAISDGRWHFINYVCNKLSNIKPNIVKYVLEKHKCMHLQCQDDGWYPAHQIINFATSNAIHIYAIDKHLEEGLDLFCITKNGDSILQFIFKKSEEGINHVLTKIDINSITFKNLVPTLLNILDKNSNINDEAKVIIKSTILT